MPSKQVLAIKHKLFMLLSIWDDQALVIENKTKLIKLALSTMLVKLLSHCTVVYHIYLISKAGAI